MKNIQTGNNASITETTAGITYYEFLPGFPARSIFAIVIYGEDCYAALFEDCSLITSVREHTCIDDALSELEDEVRAIGIDWYAPQTLGI